MNLLSYARALSGAALLLILVQSGITAAASAPPRYHSPSGKFDLVVDLLPNDWSHYQKAVPGTAKESREQYAITLYVAKSSDPVNVFYYADTDPPLPPADIIHSMLWSPNEGFLLLPDKQKAREGNHVFQLAAPTAMNKVWSLEAAHPQWIDDHRFVGDLNTPQVPGGIMEFDGTAAKAELLIPADNGIGYAIAAVSGHVITVKEFLNGPGEGKTTWALFICPALI